MQWLQACGIVEGLLAAWPIAHLVLRCRQPWPQGHQQRVPCRQCGSYVSLCVDERSCSGEGLLRSSDSLWRMGVDEAFL
jgi:hypothetical protein